MNCFKTAVSVHAIYTILLSYRGDILPKAAYNLSEEWAPKPMQVIQMAYMRARYSHTYRLGGLKLIKFSRNARYVLVRRGEFRVTGNFSEMQKGGNELSSIE